MPHPLLEPTPWRVGLTGDWSGQQSVIEIGPRRLRMVFCWCPPRPLGRTILLGSPPDEAGRMPLDEKCHHVRVHNGFWIARHPVNCEQWIAVMENESIEGGDAHNPVVNVSWADVEDFCRKVAPYLPTGAVLRPPSEEEWEYACRAGNDELPPFGIGDGQCLNSQIANFDGSFPYGNGRQAFKWISRRRTIPEGSFPPNAWGLHDMHGQLSEWCDGRNGFRALRGGSLTAMGIAARSAARYATGRPDISSVSLGIVPNDRDFFIGFRPVLTKDGERAHLENSE